MAFTVPEKSLVALPDFSNGIQKYSSKPYKIVAPDEALLPAFDRSFHFGDSIYEVFRTYQGVPFGKEEHFARFKKSMELARFEVPVDLDFLHSLIQQTCRAYFQKFGNDDLYVRFIVSRGLGDTNIDRRTSSDPYFFVIVKKVDVPKPEIYTTGLHYAVVDRRRNAANALDPAMKSGNYLNNILAFSEAVATGAHDAILLNTHGFATEGTTTNFFCVKDGTLRTPPNSAGLLVGITRSFIFEIAKELKIPSEERLMHFEDLASSDEMFTSSSVKEIMPITTLSGKPVGHGKPGPITQKLLSAYKRKVDEFVVKNKKSSWFV